MIVALGGCLKDETLSGFVPDGSTWILEEMRGAPFAERTTLTFPEPEQIAGQAPCNQYFAVQTVPYPWFNVNAVGSTRRACPALELEGTYFATLQAATLAEVAGDTLILSNEDGPLLVYKLEN